MDDIHKGMEDVLRELQGAFSFGFGMFPELEERMTGEMRRLFRPEASTSGRWALHCLMKSTVLTEVCLPDNCCAGSVCRERGAGLVSYVQYGRRERSKAGFWRRNM